MPNDTPPTRTNIAEPASAIPPRARRRRLRFGTISAVLLLGTTAIVAMLNVVAARVSYRFDATSAGDQALAPRTRKLLEGIKAPHRVVVAAPLAQIDPTARERVLDVLNDFQRVNSNVVPVVIDTASSAGLDRFRGLVGELAQREKGTLETQAATLRAAIESGRGLGAFLGGQLSEQLLRAREQMPASSASRGFLEQTSAAARVSARDLETILGRAEKALASTLGDTPLPATDVAAEEVRRALAPAIDQLAALSVETKKLADAGDTPSGAKDVLVGITASLASQRDRVATALDPVQRLKKPDILRVTSALQQGSGVVVIGPPESSVGAVDINQLFPSAEWLSASGLSGSDLGKRAEEILSTSIASISGVSRPVIVFLHADPRPIMLSSGVFDQVIERLRMRGMDVVEWACVTQGEPSEVARLSDNGKRPVVYVTFAPDSSAGASATGGQINGAQRAAKLGETIELLLSCGAPVLVSLNPSVLPTYGDKDPLVTPLARFGLSANTGKPLLSRVVRPGAPRAIADPGRRVTPKIEPSALEPSPITRAISGLPTQLAWVVPIERVDAKDAGITFAPILAAPGDDATWGESQWLRYWQTKPQDQAALPDQPQFDEGRDLKSAPGSSWTLAAAAERREGTATRRVVVVGSNGWYADAIAMASLTSDGRQGNVSPGNVELLEASIYWLAGQDDLIAQSASARSLPRVVEIDEKTRGTLRWLLIAGLPALVLCVGVIRRVVMG